MFLVCFPRRERLNFKCVFLLFSNIVLNAAAMISWYVLCQPFVTPDMHFTEEMTGVNRQFWTQMLYLHQEYLYSGVNKF